MLYVIIIKTILGGYKLATAIYSTEEIKLQNGTTVTLKPLSIKELRKFMAVIQKTALVTDQGESLDLLIEACGVALEKQAPDLVKDKDALEEALDIPTINRILEVCGGIKMDDESANLTQAAVLAGMN
jgi:hypothetical protein